MVIMDAIAPQPETKVKGHNQERPNKKSQLDKVTFADVIGNTTIQTKSKTDEAKPIAVSDDIKSSETVDDRKDTKIPETPQKPEMTETQETKEPVKMPEVLLPSPIRFHDYENMFADFKRFLAAQSEQGIQRIDLNKIGNEANLASDKLINTLRLGDGSINKEYALTWRMNVGQMDSATEEFSPNMKMPVPETMDNKMDLANTRVLDKADVLGKAEVFDKTVLDKASDHVTKLIRDLGGQVKETSQRPEIALTQRFVTNTPSQSQDGESFMNMMAPKQMEFIPVGWQSASPLTTPTTLPPQVIQAIQQAAMHLQPHQVHEMTITLHPQELGKLDIAMRMENGQLHVTIKASEMATGQFLQNQMQDLKQNLSNAGIDCANLQMDFGDHAESQSFEEAFRDGRHQFMDDNKDNQTMINNNDTLSHEELTEAGLPGINKVNIRA